ncbi:Uncharacterized protein ACMD2_11555 [Ananas comosus]|uniref:Glyoxalase At5g48480-like N-terminal domain-containing protein n=1 Tax=Ananas comosus TaxID=4615 RepID=A0A199VDZ0_ANACO|nr:Uncharacterized protein ACMD2_11555 [Ananas comosus]
MAEQENGSAAAAAAAAGMVGVKAQVVMAGAKGEEAVRFYKAAFGAEEVRRATHPKRKAEQELPLLIFAELRIGASSFLVSDRIDDDSVPAAGVKEGSGAGIVMRLEAEDLEGAVARAVAAGAELQGEIAEGEAKLLDSFGVAWIVTASAPKNPSVPAAATATA